MQIREMSGLINRVAIGDRKAHRMRFMTDTTHHRVHPVSGAVTVDGVLAFKRVTCTTVRPNVVAAAYTNSIGKPE
ncbi:DUF4394 domain-containing protein [Rhizobium wenxiniae]|uniref:DUF4394 domain-containing protein n=1 Tax=Rhizobium wenxiniae TaxID=1737357 RepID=UPI003C2ABF36